MTWGEYRDRIKRLSRAFEMAGQPTWAMHYRTDASFMDGWPLSHLDRQIEAEMLIHDLETEEARAIDALEEMFAKDKDRPYRAARMVFEETRNEATPDSPTAEVESEKTETVAV
ncbi:MAG: hypothetical protein PHI18_04750 [bacterium]|nr:hypothetical protein [bacterium]